MLEIVVILLSKVIEGVVSELSSTLGASIVKPKAEQLKRYLESRHPHILGLIQQAKSNPDLITEAAVQLRQESETDLQLRELIEETTKGLANDLKTNQFITNCAKNIGITNGTFLGEVNQTFH